MANLLNITVNDVGHLKLPSGTVAQRPASPVVGMHRYNTDFNCDEYYNGIYWEDISTGHQAGIVTSDLALYFDPGNEKSYGRNLIRKTDLDSTPAATDIYGWYVEKNGSATATRCTVSRDTTETSPVGSSPMKMVTSGNDPYINTYNVPAFNLAKSKAGETLTLSCYIKADAPTDAGLFILGAQANGAYVEAATTTVNVTTEWQRFNLVRTHNNANTRAVQIRLDGTQTYTSPRTLWFDGLQLERTSSMGEFTEAATGDSLLDISSKSNVGVLSLPETADTGDTYSPSYNPGFGSLVFNGVDTGVGLLNNPFIKTPLPISFCLWMNAASDFTGSGFLVSTDNYNCNSWALRGDNLYRGLTLQVTESNGSMFLAASYGNGGTCGSAARRTFNSEITGMTVSQWYMVTVVVRGETDASFYVNTTSKTYTTSGTGGAISYSLSSGRLGCVATGAFFFKGEIGHVMVYHADLSASDVEANFNATRDRYGV